ncbi:LAME_0C03224g1_1 [Lachancea meyersii CBS 8951]|uniref:Pumilio homology domain family member 3 n=1 Tax=Lachancea meyersii CBS 8951 TaxID=1266667 RepID=A0A1G4J0N6_9SACH|nr:LAME_0C03224g1_1 [Lachancea meyersii CBS 8951]
MSTTGNQRDFWIAQDDVAVPGSAHGANMDSELASIVSSLSALSNISAHQQHGQLGSFRRGSFHSNHSSDMESESFFRGQQSPTIKRTTLSVGDVSLGGGPSGVKSRLAKLGNYSASLAGGSSLHQQPMQGGFFERFGRSLAEGTREVEMNLGASSGRCSRRESFNAMDSISRAATNSTLGAAVINPEGRRPSESSDALESLSENLNMQQEEPKLDHRSIWKVAEAPVFRPQALATAPGDASFQPPSVDMFGNPIGNPYGIPPYPNYWKMPNPMIAPMVPSPNADGTVPSASPNSNKVPAAGNFEADSRSQYPPFMFGNNYMFFPPVVGPPSPESFRASPNPAKSSTKPEPTKPQGNPYLYNNRNHKPNNGSPGAQSFSPSPNPSDSTPHGGPRGKGKNNIIRSPLLEEFRNSSAEKSYKLPDIYGSALEFCRDQHGSRFIQQELVKATDTEKEVIFNEIREKIVTLAEDVFGNYVIQKYFEYGLKSQKDVLFEKFSGKIQKLSLQMYACRVIQRALECIEEEQKVALVNELSGCVLQMIKDQNGNHVIQKAVERIPMARLSFILGSLQGQIYHLSTHSYGCRVVQRLLEFGSPEDQNTILNDLDSFIPFLIQDQYGNYVIQHILQHGSDDLDTHIGKTKQSIVDAVSKNVVEYSKHKFASNVVEKTMLFGSPAQKKQFLDKVLPRDAEHATHLEDNAPLILMMRDQYANYVVQKLVGVAQGTDKKLAVVAIRSYLDKLNKANALGNRHLASVEKLASIIQNVHV